MARQHDPHSTRMKRRLGKFEAQSDVQTSDDSVLDYNCAWSNRNALRILLQTPQSSPKILFPRLMLRNTWSAPDLRLRLRRQAGFPLRKEPDWNRHECVNFLQC